MVCQCLQLVTAVYVFFPLVAFHVDDDDWFAIIRGVKLLVNLGHRTRYGTIDRRAHESARFCQQGSHFHLVSPLYNGLGGCAYVLAQGEDGLLG